VTHRIYNIRLIINILQSDKYKTRQECVLQLSVSHLHLTAEHVSLTAECLVHRGGTAAAAPQPFRPGEPALSGWSHTVLV